MAQAASTAAQRAAELAAAKAAIERVEAASMGRGDFPTPSLQPLQHDPANPNATAAPSDPSGLPHHVPLSQSIAHATRGSRRIYVGNIPENAMEVEILAALNGAMARKHLARYAGPPVIRVAQKGPGYVFVEVRDVDEASALLQCDGTPVGEWRLRVKRPSNFGAEGMTMYGNADAIAAEKLQKQASQGPQGKPTYRMALERFAEASRVGKEPEYDF